MPAPRGLVLAVPIALLALLLGAALARGVMAPPPAPDVEGIQREVRRLSAQVSALERKIDALETERRPERETLRPAPLERAETAPSVPAPAVPTPVADSPLRELVKQVFEERDRQAELQREERRREWEVQRAASLADQLGLAESVKGPFRAILTEYQSKARELFRKFSTEDPAAVQQELKKLQEDRDQKLAVYLSPDQIRKLGELTSRRAAPR